MATALRQLTPPIARGTPGAWLRHVPALTLGLFLAPVGAGLIGTWLPAFGYFPALGGDRFGLAPWRDLFATPGLPGALGLSVTSGGLSTGVALLLAVGFLAACHGTPPF